MQRSAIDKRKLDVCFIENQWEISAREKDRIQAIPLAEIEGKFVSVGPVWIRKLPVIGLSGEMSRA